MQTIYSKQHFLRDAKSELYGGQLVAPFESPRRAETILKHVQASGLGGIIAPDDYPTKHILRVHYEDYFIFMQNCMDEWRKAGYKGAEAIPTVWPSRRAWQQRVPNEIDGKLGYYCMSGETAISDGTYKAAIAAVNVALTGADIVGKKTQNAAFALCRPPGHHASRDQYGGFCFFNNAAVATQKFLDDGATRVAVLDVDFHHGNGTQDIFYDRDDVLFISIHGQPEDAFPHFLGYADEHGTGKGEGFNINYALPPNTAFAEWQNCLQTALDKIKNWVPDALVISLGVDTFKDDPISFFKLESGDFKTYGGMIGALKIPTLFVMEGGYAVDEIGINTVSCLTGFEDC